MTQTAGLYSFGSSGSLTGVTATTLYAPWGASSIRALQISTDDGETKFRGSGGTIKNLRVFVAGNSRTTAVTVTSRLNGSAGALSVTIPAGTTGVISDTTNSDTLADGDTFGYAVTFGASSETISLNALTAQLDTPASASINYLSWFTNSTIGVNATRFGSFGSANVTSSTENVCQIPMVESGTFSHLQAQVPTNTRTSASSLSIRINGVTGNNTLSIPASTTGFFEDTTHTDTFNAGDLVAVAIVGVAGSNATLVRSCAIKYVGATANGGYLYTAAAGVAGTAATNFWSPAGTLTRGTTENGAQIIVPTAGTLQNFAVAISTNTTGTNQTVASRINGVTGNCSITVTANTTGVFTDNTHTDTLSAGDKVAYTTGSGFTTTTTVSGFGALLVAPSSGTSVALTGVAATAAGGTLHAAFSVPTTGVAGTSATGTLKPSFSVPLTGVAGAGALGSLGLAGGGALTGVAATAALGTLKPSASLALTGVAATMGLGSVVASASIPLTGVAATVALGALGYIGATTLAGVAATGAVGHLAVSVSVPLTGVSAAADVGDVTPGTGEALEGVEADADLGFVGVSVAIALSGVAGTGAVGTLKGGRAQPLAGVSAAAFLGTLKPSASLALTGVAATGAVGHVSRGIVLAGVTAASALGTLKPSAVVALTGVSASGSVGIIQPPHSLVGRPTLGDRANRGIFCRLATDPVIRIWAGNGKIRVGPNDLDPDPEIYQGIGQLTNLPEIDRLLNGDARRIDITLSGLDQNIANLVDQDMIGLQGCRARIGTIRYDRNWRPTSDILWAWDGLLDDIGIEATQDAETGSHQWSLTVSMSSALVNRNRAQLLYWTPKDQSIVSPTDRAFDYVPSYNAGSTRLYPPR